MNSMELQSALASSSFVAIVEQERLQSQAAILVATLALLVRAAVGLYPHSGQATPPMYGDYEAQRHWMEITLHLPPAEWYHNSTSNDLLYWGLDYPPLTAYGSWLCGAIAHFFDPEWVALDTSRGFESKSSKAFMRATVLVSDLLIFFPAVFLFCRQILADFTRSKQIAIAFMILLQPGLILIDHGHFQYNCISLGLALLAIVAVMRDWDILGSVLFCLSLNYKQMSLYYAPAFFSFLLGKSLQSAHPVLRIAALGVTVIATFALCWLPFLTSIDSVAQVLHRIFPIGRGLFEDKVANVWCAVSVLIKLRAIFEQALLVRISAICTLLAILPSSVNLALRPSQTGFLYALVNSSLGFFLFSYQVHEKSILLVALPASLLLASDPLNAVFFLLLSTASMFPLLHKDGLAIPYAICIVFFVIVVLHMLNVSLQACQHLTTIGKLQLAAVIVCFSGLHLAWYFYIPPAHLPHANLLLFAVVSCASFVLFAVYFNWRQWQLNGVPTSIHKLKHS